MKNFLNKIRTPEKNMNFKNRLLNTIYVLLLGIILGVSSKWLDNLWINDAIWWHRILGALDLANVFSSFGIWLVIAIAISVFSNTPLRASLNVFFFFIGMTISYHLYTIYFSGFNPMNYMMIWYMFTLVSPILAFVCWYAKGKGKISLIISSLILCVMLNFSFSVGMWYIYFKSMIDLIIFVSTLLILYVNPKNSICSLGISFILAFIVSSII